jgi:hypothetical protein
VRHRWRWVNRGELQLIREWIVIAAAAQSS